MRKHFQITVLLIHIWWLILGRHHISTPSVTGSQTQPTFSKNKFTLKKTNILIGQSETDWPMRILVFLSMNSFLLKVGYVWEPREKAFSWISNLNQHVLTHTRKKPYQWTLCEKKSMKSSLDKHMMTHTGEKPYQCTLYNSAFHGRVVLTGIWWLILGWNHINAPSVIKHFQGQVILTRIWILILGRNHINAPCVKKTFLFKNSLDIHKLNATIWITPGRDNVIAFYCG